MKPSDCDAEILEIPCVAPSEIPVESDGFNRAHLGFNVALSVFAEVAAITAALYIVFTPEIRTDVSEKASRRRATSGLRRLERMLPVGGKIEVLFDS